MSNLPDLPSSDDEAGGCDPSPVTIENQPIDVNIVSSQVAQLDQEYICDETTDTHWVVFFSDGIEISRTDTGISCSDPIPPDTEIVRECRGGFVTVVFYSIPSDGSAPTETLASVTAEPCGSPDVQYVQVVACRTGTQHVVTSSIDPATNAVTELSAVDTGEPCGSQIDRLDVEYRCEDGTLSEVQIVSRNGIEQSRNVADTGIACESNPDIEQARVCRNNGTEDTVHIVSTSFDTDGVGTELSAIDTGEPCAAPPVLLESEQCYADLVADPDGGITYTVRTWTDGTVIANDQLGATVDVTGGIPADWTIYDCACCPVEPTGVMATSTGFGQRTLTGGGTWTITPDATYIESLSIKGIAGVLVATAPSGDLYRAATVTDSFGNTSTLHVGETSEWGAGRLPHGSPITVTVPAGGVVNINWTEPVI